MFKKNLILGIVLTIIFAFSMHGSVFAVIDPSITSMSPANGQQFITSSSPLLQYITFTVHGLASSYDYKAEYWIVVDGQAIIHDYFPVPGNAEYPDANMSGWAETNLGFGQHSITVKVKNHLKVWWWEEVSETEQTNYVTVIQSHPLSAVGISGPSSLNISQNGTWTAYTTNGYGYFQYQWYYLHPYTQVALAAIKIRPNNVPVNTWFDCGTGQSISRSDVLNFQLKCVVTDSYDNKQVTSDIFTVYVGN